MQASKLHTGMCTLQVMIASKKLLKRQCVIKTTSEKGKSKLTGKKKKKGMTDRLCLFPKMC